jgi:RNA polymerase sigma-70 factor, ECF subfamily
VTQEAFISLLRDRSRYSEEVGEVGGFAFGIARNLVRRIGWRERAYLPLPGAGALGELPSPLLSGPESGPGQLIRGERIESVRAAIASRPEHYRRAAVLCDLCELSYAEAASRLGCAAETIRSRRDRGHALARTEAEGSGQAWHGVPRAR